MPSSQLCYYKGNTGWLFAGSSQQPLPMGAGCPALQTVAFFPYASPREMPFLSLGAVTEDLIMSQDRWISFASWS